MIILGCHYLSPAADGKQKITFGSHLVAAPDAKQSITFGSHSLEDSAGAGLRISISSHTGGASAGAG